MKTYRIENWDLLHCPHGNHSHVGGQIYGHPKYPDGTWVMSDKVVYFDHDLLQAMTHTTGLLQLGEMSEKMRKKQVEGDAEAEREDLKDAGGFRPGLMEDSFQAYNPDEWGTAGTHQGVQDAMEGLNDLLKQVFGREGAPDKKRHH